MTLHFIFKLKKIKFEIKFLIFNFVLFYYDIRTILSPWYLFIYLFIYFSIHQKYQNEF